MRRLILIAVLLAVAALASAQPAGRTFPVTLTAEEVAALQAKFGADVDIPAKTQAWVHDWLVQFTRDHDEAVTRNIREKYQKLSPTKQKQVDDLLGTAVP